MENIAANRWKTREKPMSARAGRIALDNAAIIFPSTLSKTQRHLYRFAFTLYDTVDAGILQQALEDITPRFPSMVAGLRAGALWYALEPLKTAPKVTPATAQPMSPMSYGELKQCCLRVQYEGRKIIVEFFHALGDGSAALTFLKTLIAAYVSRCYGVTIPCTDGVLDHRQSPSAAELMDCYERYAGPHPLKRDMLRSFRLKGTIPKEQALTITNLVYDETAVCAAAKNLGVSVTAFVTAVMAQTMLAIQQAEHPSKPLPVRIAVPVNLRQFFPAQTLRNFSLCVTVEIDPLMGDFSFSELCTSIQHQMKLKITQKEMAAAIRTNTNIAGHPLFRCLPLWVKSPLMRIGYHICATRTACIGVSNIGRIRLPDALTAYVQDVFCTPDANPESPCSCAVLSYGGLMHVGMCRCMTEDKVAKGFDGVMKEALGEGGHRLP